MENMKEPDESEFETINPDSEEGKELGFTSDKFFGWLSKAKGFVYISFIESKDSGKGNLSELFENILSKGYGIKVPTPFPKMKRIVKERGFEKTYEERSEPQIDGSVEVWVKETRNDG